MDHQNSFSSHQLRDRVTDSQQARQLLVICLHPSKRRLPTRASGWSPARFQLSEACRGRDSCARQSATIRQLAVSDAKCQVSPKHKRLHQRHPSASSSSSTAKLALLQCLACLDGVVYLSGGFPSISTSSPLACKRMRQVAYK